MAITAQAPKMPAIGSTMPDNWPYQKLLNCPMPVRRNGTDTARAWLDDGGRAGSEAGIVVRFFIKRPNPFVWI